MPLTQVSEYAQVYIPQPPPPGIPNSVASCILTCSRLNRKSLTAGNPNPLCPPQVQTGHAAYVPLTGSVRTVRLCTFWGSCFQLEELLPDLYCLLACLLLFSAKDLRLSLYPLKSFTCNCMFWSLAPTFIST